MCYIAGSYEASMIVCNLSLSVLFLGSVCGYVFGVLGKNDESSPNAERKLSAEKVGTEGMEFVR